MSDEGKAVILDSELALCRNKYDIRELLIQKGVPIPPLSVKDAAIADSYELDTKYISHRFRNESAQATVIAWRLRK